MASAIGEKGETKMAENMRQRLELSTSCEDENIQYLTFPDGLRLIFDHGEYVGWYVCGVAENG